MCRRKYVWMVVSVTVVVGLLFTQTLAYGAVAETIAENADSIAKRVSDTGLAPVESTSDLSHLSLEIASKSANSVDRQLYFTGGEAMRKVTDIGIEAPMAESATTAPDDAGKAVSDDGIKGVRDLGNKALTRTSRMADNAGKAITGTADNTVKGISDAGGAVYSGASDAVGGGASQTIDSAGNVTTGTADALVEGTSGAFDWALKGLGDAFAFVLGQ